MSPGPRLYAVRYDHLEWIIWTEKALTLREPLTRERIIEAALHIIDGQGLGRLTMRRLGDSLEVEAMAIYHHLPHGKEQLLEQLISHVAALPVPPGAGSPRDRLRAWATAYRDRLLDHV